MKQYIAVVSHDAGIITKYQDFDTQVEADVHVAKYGGKVVEGLDDDLSYWDVSGDTPAKDTVTQAANANGRAFAALREKRDTLLHDTDWWASSDLSITEAQTTYRQALRDLPANTPDPADPTWPEEP